MATDIDAETILLDLDRGELFALQGTAQAIWHALDEATDLDGLVDGLANRFDAPRAAIAADVDAFLAELRSAGLVA